MRRLVKVSAVAGAAAGVVAVVRKVVRGRAARPRYDRWHSITIDRSPEEVGHLPRPLDRLGEEVKAYIALKQGAEATPEEIIAYAKERVAAYKYPRDVEIRDSLPKSATGKILKIQL